MHSLGCDVLIAGLGMGRESLFLSGGQINLRKYLKNEALEQQEEGSTQTRSSIK